ncbi:hypothetical protein D3C87_1585400 [compost metagenome]
MRKHLNVSRAVLVLSLLTVGQPVLANDCASAQKSVFTLAIKLADLSSTLSKAQRSIALQYDQAGYGPGPGQINQARFDAKLKLDDIRMQGLLAETKGQIKELLDSDCFSAMSEADKANLLSDLQE